MSGAPNVLMRRVNLRESHLQAGESRIVATLAYDFQAAEHSALEFFDACPPYDRCITIPH